MDQHAVAGCAVPPVSEWLAGVLATVLYSTVESLGDGWTGRLVHAADWCSFRNAMSGCRSARCKRRVADKLLYGKCTIDEVQGPGWGMDSGGGHACTTAWLWDGFWVARVVYGVSLVHNGCGV